MSSFLYVFALAAIVCLCEAGLSAPGKPLKCFDCDGLCSCLQKNVDQSITNQTFKAVIECAKKVNDKTMTKFINYEVCKAKKEVELYQYDFINNGMQFDCPTCPSLIKDANVFAKAMWGHMFAGNNARSRRSSTRQRRQAFTSGWVKYHFALRKCLTDDKGMGLEDAEALLLKYSAADEKAKAVENCMDKNCFDGYIEAKCYADSQITEQELIDWEITK